MEKINIMNKTIIVSGGTKGIGKAIINKFYNEGYSVYTCSRSAENLANLKSEFPKISTFVADLSRKDEVFKFAEFVKSSTDTIDVLVNNTGLFVPGQIHTEEDGTLESQINTNLYSAYNLSRALLPLMITKQKGDVFNMCSTASITPYINGGSYCISKYALYGMTKVLREEMKEHNIRVTAILPGATYTSSWEGVDIPEERFMPSSDVAESIWSAHQLTSRSVIEEILIRPQLGDL